MNDLEQRIINHLAKQGYKYLALNGGHARVFDPELEGVPFRRGNSMYRIEIEENGEYQWTVHGEVIRVPGLFTDKRFELIDLTKFEFQESLF